MSLLKYIPNQNAQVHIRIDDPFTIIGNEIKELLNYLERKMNTSYYYSELIDYSYELVREYFKRTYDIYLEDQLIRNYKSNDLYIMIEGIKSAIIKKWGSLTNYKLAIDINYFNRYFYVYSIKKIGSSIHGRYSERLYEEVYNKEMFHYLRMISKNIKEDEFTMTYYKNGNFKLKFSNVSYCQRFIEFTDKIRKIIVPYNLHGQL